jgi:hypothetical protein
MAEIAKQIDGSSALAEAALLALPTRIELKEDALDGANEILSELLDDFKKKS